MVLCGLFLLKSNKFLYVFVKSAIVLGFFNLFYIHRLVRLTVFWYFCLIQTIYIIVL